ncbi:MAG: cation:dicarboxylase symporter family transporter [Hyphomonadaceae bacterium]
MAGLVSGYLVGAALEALRPEIASPAGAVAETVGGLWLNALRMTIIPLIFALLSLGVVNAVGAAGRGTLALQTVGTYVGLLFIASTLGAVMSIVLWQIAPAPADAAKALTEAASGGAAIEPSPPVGEMLLGFIPSNPVAAAADGTILPLVVFTLVFGFALTRIQADRRAAMVNILQALNDTMFVIIGWVLRVAPVGVFALSASLALHSGISAFGALAHYVAFNCAIAVMVVALAYVVAWFGGGITPWRYARAILPAQAVALSTQSSLASLPAMLNSTDTLHISRTVSGVTLPMAVSIFRFGSVLSYPAVAMYAAALYGIQPDPLTIAAAVVVAVIIDQSSVGASSQLTFFTTYLPVFAVLDVPPELLGLLIAVDVLPNMLITTANVSMDVAVTASISRHAKIEASEADPTQEADPAAA